MAEAANESVQKDTSAAGNSETQQKTADQGSAAETDKGWLGGLSEGNRKLAETKGWKAPEDLDKVFTSYSEMERLQGDSLRVPAPDAPKEEQDKFFAKLGRPETADKYEFKRPEGLPPELPYSDELANAAKPWMYEAGLNPKQAQLVHDGFVKFQAEQMKAAQAALTKNVGDTHDALVKEWGPMDSEGFKTKHALANRALTKLGLTDALKKSGVILPDGTLTDPQIAKAFSAIGDAMFKEDTIDDKGGSGGGDNPFKRDAKGDIVSPDKISAVVKSDPERAKRLAREAGEPIENWMPQNPR